MAEFMRKAFIYTSVFFNCVLVGLDVYHLDARARGGVWLNAWGRVSYTIRFSSAVCLLISLCTISMLELVINMLELETRRG